MGAGTPLGSMFIELGLDTSKFDPKLQSAKRAVNYFKAEAKALDSTLKNNGKNVGLLQAKYKTLTQAINAQKKVLTHLKANFDKLDPGTAKWEAAAVQIERENAKLAQLEAQLGNVSKAFQEASGQTGFTGFLQRSGKQIDVFGQKLQTLADKTKWISAGFGAGALLSIKAASDFDTAFTGVKKTVDEVRDANGRVTYSYERLSNGIRKMAKEIPASTTEISAVAEAAGQLGIKTKDVLGFTRVMIDMGQSTNLIAEEAASSIAKIANITGLTSKEYSRFGSAVVALGNNFATTERDVVAMTNRIAASGKLAGLTNQEMLALATAMSSVGIEAEAGGTAMTQTLSAIETAVINGGEDLTKFAQIANMSSGDFAKAWKEKPIVALQEFIKGLGQLDKKGESATKVLDDLGLSGVRQSNMLKSLGLASETLGKAIDVSNTAWKENTALTNEASKRYETFQSKLKIVKNKINDIAIEIGGPLMEAASNALDALEPLFKTIGDLAKAYSNANPETKRFIAYLVAGTAAASPFLRIIGKTSSGVGTLVGWLGKLSGARKGAAALKALETATEAATTSTVSMTGAVASLSNPVTWGVVIGGAAVIGIGLIADSMYKAQKRTEEWGTAVSATEATALSNFKKKVDETNTSLQMFEVGAGSVKKVTKAFDDLVGSIEKLAQSKLDKNINLAKKLGLSEETINALKSKTESVVNNVKGMNTQIKAIMERHNGDMSKLSATEKELVLRNQREMISTQLDLMKFSASEKKALTAALNNELDALNARQLEKVSENTVKMLDKENSAYKTKKAELKEILKQFGSDTSKLSAEELAARQEVLNKLTELNMQHNLKTKALSDQYLAIQRERVQRLKESGKSQEEIHQGISQMASDMAQKLGISYDDAYRKLAYYTEKSGETLKVLSRNTANATAEVAAANAQWDSLFTSDNPQQSLNELLSTAEGWNSFEIMVKNADVEPTGRAALAEMLVAGGQWQNMTLEQKKLVVDGQQAMIEIFDSKELLAQWQALTPEEKVLLAKNLTQEPTMSAQQAIDSVKQTVPADVNATDKTAGDTQSAQRKIDNVKQRVPADVKASDKTGPDVASADRAVNSPKQNGPIHINAQNNTGSIVSEVLGALAGIPRTITIGINAIKNFVGLENGTNYHKGGPALVNDQKGPTYRELVVYPNGLSFIPEGRNVFLPDMPKGTKVLRASKTKDLMRSRGIPKYAHGVGISSESRFMRELSSANQSINKTSVSIDNSQVVALLKQLIELVKANGDKDQIIDLTVMLGNMTLVQLKDKISELQRKDEALRLKSSSF